MHVCLKSSTTLLQYQEPQVVQQPYYARFRDLLAEGRSSSPPGSHRHYFQSFMDETSQHQSYWIWVYQILIFPLWNSQIYLAAFLWLGQLSLVSAVANTIFKLVIFSNIKLLQWSIYSVFCVMGAHACIIIHHLMHLFLSMELGWPIIILFVPDWIKELRNWHPTKIPSKLGRIDMHHWCTCLSVLVPYMRLS